MKNIMRISVLAVLLAAIWTQQGWADEDLDAAMGVTSVYPNVFIILDTSGSMAEAPYRTDSGDPAPVGTKQWKKDILVDSESEPVYDGSGNLQWTDVVRTVDDDPFAAGVVPEVYLTGGDHPASKFYKAKLVLNKVLKSGEVDNVNLGFGTYLQARTPRVKALYYRESGGKYEFRWIVTPGMLRWPSGSFGYIDKATGKVTPFTNVPYNADEIVDDEVLLPPNIPIFDPPEEIRCAPIPLNKKDFPRLPTTPSLGGAVMMDNWSLVNSVMKNKQLADGTVVTVYPSAFDYSLIWYPSFPLTDSTQRPHSWSYADLTMTEILFTNMTWGQPSPAYPDDAENPATNNLGNVFVPGTEIPELSNFSGFDQLGFVHLPDPTDDDDPDMARRHREKILGLISLERKTDPTFDCRVAPNDGSTGCEFCPKGKDGVPFRQFTSMPFTSSVSCGGWTPLSQTLWNARQYYLSYFDQDLQSRGGCRENCIVLFTDGRSNCSDNNLKDHEDLVNAVKALHELVWHHGQPDEVPVPVHTYVVGFGLDAESKTLCDKIADAGGTNHAYLAEDMDELVEALKAILSGVTQGMYTRSDPVVDYHWNETEKEYKSVVYTGSFEIPGWNGHLNRYKLEKYWLKIKWNGAWYVPDSNWYDDAPTGEPEGILEGDAGARLNEQSLRKIYTTTAGGDRIEFRASNLTSLESAGLVAGGFADTATLVDYVLKGSPGDPSWKLGDIYHSTAVVTREPKGEELLKSEDAKNRDHLVTVGANDGMLHTFNDEDGSELWAYLPRCVLGSLHRLKAGHEYSVDLDVKAVDAQLSGGWATVLVGGLRQGGNYYFALDITGTDASYPKPLWEVTHSAMGQTWSAPAFGRIPGDKYVAFVGGGYSSSANVGNSFHIIDLETGEFVRSYPGLGDADEDFPGRPKAVDLNKDGYVERVYFVSTKGKLYRIKLEDSAGDAELAFDPGDYNYLATETVDGEEPPLTRIVPETASLPVNTTDMRRPGYYEPSVMKMRYYPYHYLIHYGTGDEQAILQETTQDFFFEIEDNEDEEARCNWVWAFDPGEKCLSAPGAFNYAVYFSTFLPNDICGGGNGYLYGITTTTRTNKGGNGALTYDLEDNPLSPCKSRVGGAGTRLKGIVSSPQVTNGAIVFTCSQSSVEKPGAGVPPDRLLIKGLSDIIHFWQEVY